MSDLHMRVRVRLQKLAGVGNEPARLSLNTFALKPGLGSLPTLVKRQRRLERRAVKAQQVLDQEKTTRDAIDALLVKVGLRKGEGVTCLGYDVVHNERNGRTSLNADKLRGESTELVFIAYVSVANAMASAFRSRTGPLKLLSVSQAAW